MGKRNEERAHVRLVPIHLGSIDVNGGNELNAVLRNVLTPDFE